MGISASQRVWDELDGVASRPLAQSSSQESKAISACSTDNQHMVQPTGVGLLILSSDRSILYHVQPQFLSQASACCSALSPRVMELQLERAWFGMAGMMGWVCQKLDGMGHTWPPQQTELERFDKVALSLG